MYVITHACMSTYIHVFKHIFTDRKRGYSLDLRHASMSFRPLCPPELPLALVCMYVRAYIYIVYICIYIYILSVDIKISIHVCAYMYICTHVSMQIYIYIYIRTYIDRYIDTYIHACINITCPKGKFTSSKIADYYIYIYIYIYYDKHAHH